MRRGNPLQDRKHSNSDQERVTRMTYAKSKGNGRGLLACVWACALVLALLVVVSASSVGAYAATYSARDPQVLFLDAATDTELTSTMDLFDAAYVNASGQTVVASSDGEKVVAPGTSGSYDFAVRNSGGTKATYKVWAETEQSGTTIAIPLELTLANGSTACDNLADSGELAPGKSAVYRIAWTWPFEDAAEQDAAANGTTASDANADAATLTTADARDTALGDIAATRRASYKVTLHMTAEADYPARTGRAPQTGDTTNLAAPAIIAAVAVVLIVVALIVRRRNKDGR